jgi:hypothetical protein
MIQVNFYNDQNLESVLAIVFICITLIIITLIFFTLEWPGDRTILHDLNYKIEYEKSPPQQVKIRVVRTRNHPGGRPLISTGVYEEVNPESNLIRAFSCMRPDYSVYQVRCGEIRIRRTVIREDIVVRNGEQIEYRELPRVRHNGDMGF